MKEWHKSTYSDGGGGNCVEVAEGPVTGIRDTQNRPWATCRPRLLSGRRSWPRCASSSGTA